MTDDAFVPRSIEDEYEEMSLEEIMNGKVRWSASVLLIGRPRVWLMSWF